MDIHTSNLGHSNTLLLSLEKSSNQNQNKQMLKIIDIINQKNLTDIYRIFNPRSKGHTLFPEYHETFSKIDHILRHKTGFNGYRNLR